MSTISDALVDDVRDVLCQAERSLSAAEILEQCVEAESTLDVSKALRALHDAGELVMSLGGGLNGRQHCYRLKDHAQAPASVEAAVPNEQSRPTIRADVEAYLRDNARPLLTREVAEALGRTVLQVSNALAYLQRQGVVASRRRSGGVQREWWLVQHGAQVVDSEGECLSGFLPDAEEIPCTIEERQVEPPAVTDLPPVKTPAGPQRLRCALFSDGSLVIQHRGRLEEFSAEEAEQLYSYLEATFERVALSRGRMR